MAFIRPNVRLFEILDNEEAVKILDKYAPGVSSIDIDSNDANFTLHRIIGDDYHEVKDQVFAELEQIEY